MQLLSLLLFLLCLGLGHHLWLHKRLVKKQDELIQIQQNQLRARPYTIYEMEQRNLLDQDEIIYRIKCTDEFRQQWIDYMRDHQVTDFPFAKWVREVYLYKEKENSLSDLSTPAYPAGKSAVNKSSSHA